MQPYPYPPALPRPPYRPGPNTALSLPHLSSPAADPLPPSPERPDGPDLVNKLPSELLKHILRLVNAQDAVFNRRILGSNVARKHESPTTGKWSPWHGRGVAALSLTNRRMRALALPSLFETVVPAQLAASCFQYELMGTPLATHIRHIDLCPSRDSQIHAAARSLRFVPCLRQLSLHSDAKPFFISLRSRGFGLDDDDQDELENWEPHYSSGQHEGPARGSRSDEPIEERRATAHAFKIFMKTRLEHVRLTRFAETELEAFLHSFTAHGVVKTLEIEGLCVLGSKNYGIKSYLHASKLEALHLRTSVPIHDYGGPGGIDLGVDLSAWADVRMSHLRHLELSLSPRTLNDNVGVLGTLAPNLIRLELSLDDGPPYGPVSEIPPVNLLSLSRLHLSISPSFLPLLEAFQTCPFLSAIVSFTELQGLPSHVVSPSLCLPSTLTDFHLQFPVEAPLEDVESLVAAFAQRNVGLFVQSLRAYNANFESFSQPPYTVEERGDLVLMTLGWATQRVEWLKRTGDSSGLRELSDALRYVREREMMERH
ncbi:hypothetical protein JCM11641_003490 [Rhodosporidiobolus odoratus]